MDTQDEVMKEWKRIVGDAYLIQDKRTLLQILADWHLDQVLELKKEIDDLKEELSGEKL